MLAQPRQQQVAHRPLQGFQSGLRVAGCGQGQFDVGIDQLMQLRRQRRQMLDPAVMRQIRRLGIARHQSIDRCMQRFGLELHRRGGGEDEGLSSVADFDIEFPIGNAEGVAGEQGVAGHVVDAVMMPRMPRRIDEFQATTVEIEHEAVVRFDHPRRRDRHDLAIQLAEHCLAIDRHRSLHQLAWVDHVPRATWMHNQFGIRAGRDEGAGGAGVVEVDVGDDDEIHRFRRHTQIGQGGQDMRHGIVGAGIDNRGVALFNDQVHGGEPGADIFGIQGDDAERVVMRCCGDHGSRRVFCGYPRPPPEFRHHARLDSLCS
jgi:hypothetical protein